MEHKELIEKINGEWEQMKALLNGRADAEVKKFGDTLGETKAALAAFNGRLDALEVAMKRPGRSAGGDADRQEKSARYQAFMKALRHGPEKLTLEETKALEPTPEERKLMVVSGDPTGGIGAPSEFSMDIIKGVVQISPVRSLVRVRNTSMRSVKVMKRTGTFAAVWVSEVGTRAETDGLRYGLEEIPTHEIYAMVDISQQDLEDVAFDLEGELRQEFSEQFALSEGTAVISGDSNGKPEGFMANAAVPEEVTGDAANLTYTGLVSVSHNGKEPYFAGSRFVFNLKTLGKIRLMTNGEGDPLWAPMASGAPATVLGFPYTILQGMADVAGQAYPVACGDFMRAYQMVDRVAFEIERDPFTQKAKGAVRFYARKRLGGQVVLAEAIRKLKVSA